MDRNCFPWFSICFAAPRLVQDWLQPLWERLGRAWFPLFSIGFAAPRSVSRKGSESDPSGKVWTALTFFSFTWKHIDKDGRKGSNSDPSGICSDWIASQFDHWFYSTQDWSSRTCSPDPFWDWFEREWFSIMFQRFCRTESIAAEEVPTLTLWDRCRCECFSMIFDVASGPVQQEEVHS
jgi:hypothetical protein